MVTPFSADCQVAGTMDGITAIQLDIKLQVHSTY
jgi:polyribonucleotide nucleotidyltransferase